MKLNLLVILILFSGISFISSCNKDKNFIPENSTDQIKIDSISVSKRNLVVWEESTLKIYARGTFLNFKWEADHGSILHKDSTSVLYWACPSCLGTNTIKCIVSNDLGSVSDTVKIHITE